MKLEEQLLAIKKRVGAIETHMWISSDHAFYLGAAAMAEQFAQGQGTVLMLLRDLAEIMTRNSQLLAEELRKLRNVQAESAGLNQVNRIQS